MPEDCVAQMPLSLALRPGKSAKASDKLYSCFLISAASPLLVGALQGCSHSRVCSLTPGLSLLPL